MSQWQCVPCVCVCVDLSVCPSVTTTLSKTLNLHVSLSGLSQVFSNNFSLSFDDSKVLSPQMLNGGSHLVF